MNAGIAFVLGLAAGGIVAGLLITPSDCCARVAAGVRDRVGTALGGTAQSIGDALGIWQYTPGLLKALGVQP
jgi:hypothetical protein